MTPSERKRFDDMAEEDKIRYDLQKPTMVVRRFFIIVHMVSSHCFWSYNIQSYSIQSYSIRMPTEKKVQACKCVCLHAELAGFCECLKLFWNITELRSFVLITQIQPRESVPKRKKTKRDPNQPKRPLTPFFFFCAENRWESGHWLLKKFPVLGKLWIFEGKI